MVVKNFLKRLFSFGFLGFVNFQRYKKYNLNSFELKDRLNNYNMKYPESKSINEFLKENLVNYLYILLANFVFIMFGVLGFKFFGILSVLFFVFTELHLFDDKIMITFNSIISNKNHDWFKFFSTYSLDNLLILTMILGVLAVCFKNK